MNIFQKIQVKTPKTSAFNLSHDLKTTTKMTELTPILVQEVLPGDTFDITTSSLIRFAPMVAPVMHKLDVYKYFFFVPNRLSWDGWNDFITGTNPDLVCPYIKGTEITPLPITEGSLLDYMGLPLTDNMVEPVSVLPIMAYHRIIGDYFLDQNNDPKYPFYQDGKIGKDISGDISSGVLNPILNTIYDEYFRPHKKAWMHDYFTSALPFAQRGASVKMPFDLEGDIEITNYKRVDGGSLIDTYNDPINGDLLVPSTAALEQGGHRIKLTGDLSDAEITNEVTINDLRRATALQKFLEKSARAGNRVTEYLRSIWGVKPDDLRLGQALYLGGSKDPVVTSEVLQTSATELVENGTAQGNQAGHGISYGRGNGCKYTATEHGYIIGIQCIMPNSSYAQGIPKTWSRLDRFDFAIPDFAQIGEQEVKNKELWYSKTDEKNDDTFGYLPRYAEYKFNFNRTAGAFRANEKHWTLTRFFENRPLLNEDFIYATEEEMKRIFAYFDPEDPEATPAYVYNHIHFSIRATRKLPKFGTPAGL